MSDTPESTTVEATFLFADIAGFTALTEAHGDHDAAALVADFCRSVRAELPASGDTLGRVERPMVRARRTPEGDAISAAGSRRGG